MKVPLRLGLSRPLLEEDRGKRGRDPGRPRSRTQQPDVILLPLLPGVPSPLSLGALGSWLAGVGVGTPGGRGEDLWVSRARKGGTCPHLPGALLPACQLPPHGSPHRPTPPSASKAETTWVSCHGNCRVLFESQAGGIRSWLGEGSRLGTEVGAITPVWPVPPGSALSPETFCFQFSPRALSP